MSKKRIVAATLLDGAVLDEEWEGRNIVTNEAHQQYRRYWTLRRRCAQNQIVKNREALENGGPEKLDVADLRERLNARKP